MATITFKSKIIERAYVDGTHAYTYLAVPQLKRGHCNMNEFRVHPKLGFLANSDMFQGVLDKLRRDLFPNGYVRLDAIPSNVSVNKERFLAEVTITV